jgi:hypothetical protein
LGVHRDDLGALSNTKANPQGNPHVQPGMRITAQGMGGDFKGATLRAAVTNHQSLL